MIPSRFNLLTLITLVVSVIVSRASDSQINFRTQIVPILSKAGCNSGACHGAAVGQGGFRLSLLGYDPQEDYWNITREIAGRRVDLDKPHESLFLKKPTREIDHEGGRRIKRNSPNHSTLLRWIEAGTPYGDPDLHVVRIEVTPDDLLFASLNQSAQLQVTAYLSDGSVQDVTSLALYTSNDDALADVTPEGKVISRNRGLTSIMIRYGGQVGAARVALPFSDATIGNFSPHNFIDEHVLAELKRLGIPPSPPANDATFLRRVHLDLIGRLPEIHETKAFLSDPGPEARTQLVDQLLASESFVDFWTLKLADLLLISGKRGSEQATLTYHNWLREQIAKNEPWDKITRTLLTASGDTTAIGPANFFLLATDPRDQAEHVGSIFLGARIGCARCHAHPSDRWTQADYYQFSAYFARLSREGSEITQSTRAILEYPKSKRLVPPRPLTPFASAPPEDADPRPHLAEWMTAPDNPLFARAFVNRVWKHLLGRGLFEPVDDLRPTNPASLPKLLDALATKFIENHYDLRWLVRTIVSSRTYQLSSKATPNNQGDLQLFSHAYLKPLSAQVLLDAAAQVSGVPEHFAGYPEGTRAVELIGVQTPSYALDVLGRCKRETACEPAGSGGGLAQALHLINGSAFNARLSGGILDQLQAAQKSYQEIIADLYLLAFTRPPTPDELDFWDKTIVAADNKSEILEDFLWSLLNSREFTYNH